MHILVTGASGLVGSHTVTYLLSENHTVLALDITPFPSTPTLHLPSRCVKLDMMDHHALDDLFQTSSPAIDAVIHLGAIPHPLDTDPREIYANNTVSNYNILRTALDHGVERIVQASSVNAPGMEFTARDRWAFDRLPLDEGVMMKPEDPYSFGKQVSELQASACCRLFSKARIASLRMHMVTKDYAEAYPTSHYGRLWSWTSLHSAAKACLLGLTSPNWTGHEVFYICARDICHEGGLEEATRLKAGEMEEGKGGRERLSTRDLLSRFWPDSVLDEGWWGGVGNERRGCFDCTKAERVLGWTHEP